MENSFDIFSRVTKEMQGGLIVARAIANTGEPAKEVLKTAIRTEVIGPVAQRITNIHQALRQLNYVPSLRR